MQASTVWGAENASILHNAQRNTHNKRLETNIIQQYERNEITGKVSGMQILFFCKNSQSFFSHVYEAIGKNK